MGARYKGVFLTASGKKRDKTTMGDKSRQQKKTFRKRTGRTAFSDKDIFLKTSYKPNKKAEMNAEMSHII